MLYKQFPWSENFLKSAVTDIILSELFGYLQ